jgi:hypothetical protein
MPGRHSRHVPAWLLGLIIAVVVFGIIVILAAVLGFGDDPVVDNLGAVFD